jgi:hypothetical protein
LLWWEDALWYRLKRPAIVWDKPDIAEGHHYVGHQLALAVDDLLRFPISQTKAFKSLVLEFHSHSLNFRHDKAVGVIRIHKVDWQQFPLTLAHSQNAENKSTVLDPEVLLTVPNSPKPN